MGPGSSNSEETGGCLNWLTKMPTTIERICKGGVSRRREHPQDTEQSHCTAAAATTHGQQHLLR